MNSNDEDELDVWISSSWVNRLKLKKTIFIFLDLMINESINEDTQAIINELFLEKMNISKIDSVGPPQFVALDAQYASVLESVMNDVSFSRLQCYM